eukprot:TRINITY_DN5411_c0_g1_i1.p1 TRINITY_DN5411_c0_g1~~TRINITY_DN5411_c0_g1_i1.p1  ORF type:complete len:553 (-),score=149.31 TRINITY_DN5411_c0_g1_i1:10-1668(-)
MKGHNKKFHQHSEKKEKRKLEPNEEKEEEEDQLEEQWNQKDVILPHSPNNIVVINNRRRNFTERSEFNKWGLACEVLEKKIKNSQELFDAICHINPHKNRSTLVGIIEFFYVHGFDSKFKVEVKQGEKRLRGDPGKPDNCGFTTVEQSKGFFGKTLPFMQKVALESSTLFPHGLPKLVQNENGKVILSRRQCACLMANAFFCTLFEDQVYENPTQGRSRSKKEVQIFPSFNFLGFWKRNRANHLFSSEAAKLFCFIHYFERLSEDEETLLDPKRRVIFKRRSIEDKDFPDWKNCEEVLINQNMDVVGKGSIEDSKGDLQVDFANLSLGGGVLSGGCVQEEIRFSICPEFVVGMLFNSHLKENETIIIKGAEQFSNYKGYGREMEFAGDHKDSTGVVDGVIDTTIVAMDAVDFIRPAEQYKERWIMRELNKAFCGFFSDADDVKPLQAIATGNWGCGVFNGDKQLKFLIQLMSASICNRSIKYYTFGDEKLRNELISMHKFLSSNQFTIGKLAGFLLSYGKTKRETDLFEWVIEQFGEEAKNKAQTEPKLAKK